MGKFCLCTVQGYIPIIGRDGIHFYEDEEGNKYLMNEPHERKKLFEDRVTIGAHLGGNWKSRKASMKDSVNFLLENVD